jgi:hypothetical protein
MQESEILRGDREDASLLSKRMKPEERLVAHFHHSQLMNRIYQAGVDYRSGSLPSSKKRIHRKR